MLVTIVAVPNADNTGLDVDRLEQVEDLPTEVALKMLEVGTARQPSEAELAAYHDSRDTRDEQEPGPAVPARTAVKKTAVPAAGIPDAV
ncbi:hypothetical protein ABT369_38860 [Dactylosporangium sp. NPDC000244]|uniref:hypothetical protein n=1 Tax=Dactylosporangium sp. NPDC000244 TaxID=3154365 RepID=UPI00331C68CE